MSLYGGHSGGHPIFFLFYTGASYPTFSSFIKIIRILIYFQDFNIDWHSSVVLFFYNPVIQFQYDKRWRLSLTIRNNPKELKSKNPLAMIPLSTSTSSFLPPRMASRAWSARYPPATNKNYTSSSSTFSSSLDFGIFFKKTTVYKERKKTNQ